MAGAGIFIEERSGPPFIRVVDTAVTLFVGVALPVQDNASDLPVLLRSVRDFDGNFQPGSPRLAEAVELFFLNGGKLCYVLPLGSPDVAGYAPVLERLPAFRDVTLLVLPDAPALGGGAFEVYRLALQRCAEKGDCFALLDVPPVGSDPEAHIRAFRTGMGEGSGDVGAAYYPMMVRQGEIVPVSGAIAGLYARQDEARGVWKAPAGETLKGFGGPVVAVSRELEEFMNDTGAGASVNAVRAMPDGTLHVHGARTLAAAGSPFRYVPVRRTVTMISSSIAAGLAYLVFEPNDAAMWVRAKAGVENFLITLWRAGALAGRKPEEAFFVRGGLGETMTALDIEQGRFVLMLGVALLQPGEFILERLAFRTAGAG